MIGSLIHIAEAWQFPATYVKETRMHKYNRLIKTQLRIRFRQVQHICPNWIAHSAAIQRLKLYLWKLSPSLGYVSERDGKLRIISATNLMNSVAGSVARGVQQTWIRYHERPTTRIQTVTLNFNNCRSTPKQMSNPAACQFSATWTKLALFLVAFPEGALLSFFRRGKTKTTVRISTC